MLLRGEIMTGPSPCGDNCSYALSFVGPTLKCEDITTSNPGLNASIYLAEQHRGIGNSNGYIATNNYVDGSWGETTNGLMNGTLGVGTKTLDFLVTWIPDSEESLKRRTIQCVLWAADYHVDMEYRKGEQHTNTMLNMIRPLNGTLLTTERYVFYQVNEGSREPVKPEIFMEFQARAIRDAVVNPLLGYIFCNGHTTSTRPMDLPS